jgi:rubrerythrin
MTLEKALKTAMQDEQKIRDLYGEEARRSATPDAAKEMFAGFLVIEENHVSAVEAELNYLNKSGFFFDVREFDMEG